MSSPSRINSTKAKRRALPRKKACQNCTRSKVRCGLEKPACSRCRSQGRDCQYPSGGVDPSGSGSTRDTGDPEPSIFDIQGLSDASIAAASVYEPLISDPTTAPCSSHPPVSRERNQADELNFINIELTPSPNAVDIRDRWLRPYLLPPLGRDEIPKAYHPFTLQYISTILKTYPRYMLKEGGVPPIIHPTQVRVTQMPRALANCYSLVRMWEQAAPGSEVMVTSTLETEMERLANGSPSAHDHELLACFQAYLIYTILMYFSPLGTDSTVTDNTMMTLMELAFRTARNGLFCTAEIAHTRPSWESWIVVSAKRRAIFTMYLLSSVYNSDRHLPNFVADEVRGVYLPESRVLWEAKDREAWGREYDRHLLEWEDGMLEVSELWRSAETGSVERRKRIARWVQGVDEFGMMLFAVCAHIHGC